MQRWNNYIEIIIQTIKKEEGIIMLDIETKYGCFGHFKDVFLFMQEECLEEIEIIDLKYFLNSIVGKGTYTIEQIKQIIQ